MPLHLSIITPDQSVYDGDVVSVTLPTTDGEITVLPRHVPLITTIKPGTVVVRSSGHEELFAVSRGVIEVDGSSVHVLADIADRADQLEETAIAEAKERAEKLMTEKRADVETFAEATAILDRELARLKTVRRHRNRRSTLPPSQS